MKSYIKDYPRPQLVRRKWNNMNGAWAFLFDDDNTGEASGWYTSFPAEQQTIMVPFTYETAMSGINRSEHHKNVWYSRTMELSGSERKDKRLFLHFEGSDYTTKAWINGVFVGSHSGGYARFSFDITEYAHTGDNTLTVKVEDSMDAAQPRGKQRWAEDNFACWYVQTTGIWKTVWVETVSTTYLSRLKITPDIEKGNIELVYDISAPMLEDNLVIEAVITYDGKPVAHSRKHITRLHMKDTISVYLPELTPWGVHTWTPASPSLYDLEIRILQNETVIDEIFSYFGMREIRIDQGNVLLNGTPLYQRLILDQGYWAQSHLTPPSEEALIDDIDKILELGYNGLRKHMKTEDERFLYWCDVKGMLVWSEMAASYEFNDNAIEKFTREWMEIVNQNYNHPSIIVWTPFNESWGISQIKTNKQQQQLTEGIYHLTKSLDPMRPVIVNDGWEHTVSDILTLHDYEEDGDVFFNRYAEHLDDIANAQLYHNAHKAALANGYAYKGQPIIISEYGGIAFSGGSKEDWGYGNTVATDDEFLRRFDKITTAIKQVPYIVGYCYTQVSDVQQEINGLLTVDRTFKLPAQKISEINRREVGLHKINP